MAEIKRKNAQKKSQSAILKDSIMTGISYMIPVIVGGGVLQAIAKMMGGYDVNWYKFMEFYSASCGCFYSICFG